MSAGTGDIGRGAFWNGVTAAANQVIRFVLFVVLARLVTPGELGLVAIGMVVIDLLQTLASAGIGDAVVQQEELDDVGASTAFWLMLGIGVGVAVAVAAGSPWIGGWFGKPGLAPVVAALSLIFVLTPLQTVHMAWMSRAFRFRQIALRMLIANLVGGGIGVAMAAEGWGIWALVGRSVAVPLIAAAFLWIVFPWRPRLVFDRAVARRQLGFGARVIGGQVVTALNGRWIDLVAGALLVPAALGLLRVGGQCTLLLLEITMVPFIHLALPILSRSRAGEDGGMNDGAYLSIARLSAATIFPAFFGTAAVADLLFPLMFGAKWSAVGTLMPALCAIAVPLQLTLLVGPALTAAGRPGEALRWTAVQLVAMAPCTLIGAWFGVIPLAWSAVVGAAVAAPVGLVMLRRNWGVAPGAVLAAAARPLAAAAAMALGVWWLGQRLEPALGPLSTLSVCIAAGVVSYAAIIRLAVPALWREWRASLSRGS